MADTTAEIYILLTKEQVENERLKTLISDLRMENAALRTENDYFRSASVPKGNNNNREYTI